MLFFIILQHVSAANPDHRHVETHIIITEKSTLRWKPPFTVKVKIIKFEILIFNCKGGGGSPPQRIILFYDYVSFYMTMNRIRGRNML
jgi:hypothetical protein